MKRYIDMLRPALTVSMITTGLQFALGLHNIKYHYYSWAGAGRGGGRERGNVLPLLPPSLSPPPP